MWKTNGKEKQNWNDALTEQNDVKMPFVCQPSNRRKIVQWRRNVTFSIDTYCKFFLP